MDALEECCARRLTALLLLVEEPELYLAALGYEPATLGLTVRRNEPQRAARFGNSLQTGRCETAANCSEPQGMETSPYSRSYSRSVARLANRRRRRCCGCRRPLASLLRRRGAVSALHRDARRRCCVMRWATAAASTRLETLSFRRMFVTWTLAVFALTEELSGDLPIRAACARQVETSASRAVNPSSYSRPDLVGALGPRWLREVEPRALCEQLELALQEPGAQAARDPGRRAPAPPPRSANPRRRRGPRPPATGSTPPRTAGRARQPGRGAMQATAATAHRACPPRRAGATPPLPAR